VNAKALLWIPALWALAFGWHASPVEFTPVFLAVPLAALLGERYGRRALWLVAIGGLPLLAPFASFGFVTLGSAPDVYVVALAVCAIVVSERPVAERVARFGGPLFAAALVLLPMTMSVGGIELHGLRIDVVFGFTGLFWLLLFLLGWSNFPAGWALASLALAMAAGMWLHTLAPADGRVFFGGPQAQLPLFGLTRMVHLWWDYRFDTPATFLVGVGYFASGRLWAEMLRTRAAPLAPRDAYALLLLVAALALGFFVNRAALLAIGFEADALPRYGFLLGAPLALPLMGLFGGLLLGRRGIAVAVLAVPAFWALDAFAMSGFRFPLRAFSAGVHQPLCVLGFGLLGLAMRERALGAATRLGPRLRGDDGMGAGDYGMAAGDGGMGAGEDGRGAALPAWALWPRLAAGARAGRYAALVLIALPLLYAGALALSSEERIVAAAKALFQDRRASPATVQRPGTGPRPKKSGSEP
jgi:hypothetical protein